MYVAQEQVVRSTSPVYDRKTLRPAHIALRSFGVMGQSEFEIMPGGLVRLSGELQPLESSLRVGERSKDAWVLSSAPIARVTLLKQPEHGVDLKRTGGELPSRIAENLFWLGRNLERADVTARVLRTTISRLTSEEQIDEMPEVVILLRTMAEMGMIETGYGVAEMRRQLPPIETQSRCEYLRRTKHDEPAFDRDADFPAHLAQSGSCILRFVAGAATASTKDSSRHVAVRWTCPTVWRSWMI